MGFFTRLKEGLTKTRDSFVKNMDSVFSGSGVIDVCQWLFCCQDADAHCWQGERDCPDEADT